MLLPFNFSVTIVFSILFLTCVCIGQDKLERFRQRDQRERDRQGRIRCDFDQLAAKDPLYHPIASIFLVMLIKFGIFFSQGARVRTGGSYPRATGGAGEKETGIEAHQKGGS